MIGIVSAAGYVPRYRLSAKTLGAVWGAGGAGERAVANYDEDSLTMACEAALDALHGRDGRRVGACFFASTTRCGWPSTSSRPEPPPRHW